MDDRETKEMLSEKFDQFQIWLIKTQHRSTPLKRVFKYAQLVESLYSGQIQCIYTRL